MLIFLLVILFVPVQSSAKSFDGKEFYRSLSQRLGRKRADYPALSDSEFANFRMVRTSGIAEGKG